MNKMSLAVRLLSSLVIAASILPAFNSSAQSCPTTPPIKYVGWVKGASVNVFIDTVYTDAQGNVTTMTLDQQLAIAAAFDNWTSANNAQTGGNNSQVSYTVVSNRSQAQFTVQWGDPHDPNGTALAGTSTITDASGYYTVGAVATIRPSVTGTSDLTEVMAHEIGHPAGFGDCDACPPGSSVMASTCCYSNSPTGPTACDNSKLMQSNYPPCSAPAFSCSGYDPNTCKCDVVTSGGGAGGGTDPVVYNLDAPCLDWYLVTYVSYNGGPWQTFSVQYLGCW
jgi:hypothetical protein